MEKRRQPVSRLTLVAFCLGLLVVLAAVMAGFGTRLGWWNFRTGFVILRWAAYGGVAVVAVSIAGCVAARPGGSRRGFVFAFLGLLCGFMTFSIPYSHWRTAQRVPPIHDITTDTENPPPFVSIVPLRKDAPNAAEYGGPEIASQQRAAYPDISPVFLPLPHDQAFERAYRTARKMGWKIVDRNVAEGRIEATATTFWFGFADDIVIRVTPKDGGSRIDIRSVSRVGRSDVGTNARRIRKCLRYLRE